MIAYLDALTLLQAILIFIGIGAFFTILAAHLDRRAHEKRVKRAQMLISRNNTVRRMATYRRTINRK